MNTIDVIDRGLRCLSENLGVIETELFISTLLREQFDYTKWRQRFVDEIKTFDDLDALLTSAKDQPCFGGNADVVL